MKIEIIPNEANVSIGESYIFMAINTYDNGIGDWQVDTDYVDIDFSNEILIKVTAFKEGSTEIKYNQEDNTYYATLNITSTDKGE